MPKLKELDETDAPINTTHNRRPKVRRRRRKKKITIEWLNLLRVSFLLLLVGIIVFHYYLITENRLGSYYLEIWKRHKDILTPMILFISYTLAIFLVGYKMGRR